ncbi:hypothetical protein MHBO_002025 [Bonamia ostreae]|uniref:Origin recognition complex subunit 5 C-terminal domain-containing protein n=1 Tax=Bonamia ostreae TaxID=126728 RepID=A0ABV2AKZ0_9EUKA
MEEKKIESIKSEYVHRESEIDQIFSALNSPKNFSVRLLLIYGFNNTGKTSILSKIVKLSFSVFAFIDCRLFDDERNFYEEIIYQLNSKHEKLTLVPKYKALKFSDFCEKLNSINKSFCLVFDHFESIQKFGKMSLERLTRITDEIENAKIVFVQTGFDTKCLLGNDHIYKIFFDNLDKKQLSEIISSKLTKHKNIGLNKNDNARFKNLAKRVCDVFSVYTFDLQKLLQICYYLINELNGEFELSEIKKIERKICLNFNNLNFILAGDKNKKTDKLPKTFKYLIIGTFLASFLEKSMDKKIFNVFGDIKKNKKVMYKKISKTPKQTTLLAGPKIFNFARFSKIFNFVLSFN